MQNLARDHSRRIFEENEKLRTELDSKKKELDLRREQLEKLAAQNDVDKRKLEQEKQKVTFFRFILILPDNATAKRSFFCQA